MPDRSGHLPRPAIPLDVIYPRDLAHRFRLYLATDDGLDVLATAPDPEGVGAALVCLNDDEKERGRRLMDRGKIGILDVCPDGEPSPRGEWIILPWHRGE